MENEEWWIGEWRWDEYEEILNRKGDEDELEWVRDEGNKQGWRNGRVWFCMMSIGYMSIGRELCMGGWVIGNNERWYGTTVVMIVFDRQ